MQAVRAKSRCCPAATRGGAAASPLRSQGSGRRAPGGARFTLVRRCWRLRPRSLPTPQGPMCAARLGPPKARLPRAPALPRVAGRTPVRPPQPVALPAPAGSCAWGRAGCPTLARHGRQRGGTAPRPRIGCRDSTSDTPKPLTRGAREAPRPPLARRACASARQRPVHGGDRAVPTRRAPLALPRLSRRGRRVPRVLAQRRGERRVRGPRRRRAPRDERRAGRGLGQRRAVQLQVCQPRGACRGWSGWVVGWAGTWMRARDQGRGAGALGETRARLLASRGVQAHARVCAHASTRARALARARMHRTAPFGC